MANADAGMEPRWQHLLGDANDETDPPGFQLHGFIDHNLNGVYIRSRETTPGHINNRYLSYRCLSTGIFMWYQEKKQRYCVSFPTDPVHGDLWQRVKTGEEWAVAWYRPIFSAAGSVGELEDRWMEQNPQTGLLDLHPRGAITYKKLERAEVFAYLRARGSMAPPETSEPPRRSVPSTNPYTPAPRPGNVTPTSLLPALAGDAAPSAANRPGNVTPTSLLPALAGDAAPSAANRPGNVTPTSLLPALAGDAAPSAANRPGNVTPTSLLPALAGDAIGRKPARQRDTNEFAPCSGWRRNATGCGRGSSRDTSGGREPGTSSSKPAAAEAPAHG
ncbi:unnamed protein product [Symbiodinium natans]|uniref:Uncharacterized protein n=1 Tax=Symbiodinium natans TaxID=878477 RepID=A0A812LHE0_9DINO|nr:unnamed protein product [Symbiodinium natans]